MAGIVTGAISAFSGLVGMFGGLRGARAGPGIGPMFSVLSGQEQQRAAREEAMLLGRQGDIAFEESLRSAAQREREVRAFKEEQALRFATSGVSLEGSPLGVLEETRQLGQEEVEAIKRRGKAQSELFSLQGLQLLRRGSAAAFTGFAQGLQGQFESRLQAAALRTQAFQTGLAGLGYGGQLAFGQGRRSIFGAGAGFLGAP